MTWFLTGTVAVYWACLFPHLKDVVLVPRCYMLVVTVLLAALVPFRMPARVPHVALALAMLLAIVWPQSPVRDAPSFVYAWWISLGGMIAIAELLRVAARNSGPTAADRTSWCMFLAGALTAYSLVDDVLVRFGIRTQASAIACLALYAVCIVRGRFGPTDRERVGEKGAPAAGPAGTTGIVALARVLVLLVPIAPFFAALDDLGRSYGVLMRSGTQLGAEALGLAIGLAWVMVSSWRRGTRPDAEVHRAGRSLVHAAVALGILWAVLSLVPGHDVNMFLHERFGLRARLGLWREIPLALVVFTPSAVFAGMAIGRIPGFADTRIAVLGFLAAYVGLPLAFGLVRFERLPAAFAAPTWALALLVLAGVVLPATARRTSAPLLTASH